MSDQDVRAQLEDLFSQLKLSPGSPAGQARPLVQVGPDHGERFRMLIEHLPVGIYRITPKPHARLLMANQAFCDLFGVERQDMLDRAGQEPAALDQSLKPGKVTEKELPLRRQDGTLVWCLVRSREMCGPGGEVVYCDCVVVDITQRKQAEQAAALGWWSRLALDAMPEAVLVIKSNRLIALANTAAEKLLGYTKDELVRLSPDALYSSQRLDLDEVLYKLAEGQALDLTLDVLDKQGRVLSLEHSLRVIEGGRGQPIAILVILRPAERSIAVEDISPIAQPILDPSHTCAYLGLYDDTTTRYSYPTSENYCHAQTRPQRVEIAHQADVCMTDSWAACPRYKAVMKRRM